MGVVCAVKRLATVWHRPATGGRGEMVLRRLVTATCHRTGLGVSWVGGASHDGLEASCDGGASQDGLKASWDGGASQDGLKASRDGPVTLHDGRAAGVYVRHDVRSYAPSPAHRSLAPISFRVSRRGQQLVPCSLHALTRRAANRRRGASADNGEPSADL